MSYFGPCKKKCIDKYSYLSTNILGQGYSGTVYLGKHQVTGNVCAIKIIQKSILKYQAHKSMILCQIQFLNILKDKKNILTLYQVYNTKNNIYIVSQLCNTDLKQYITAKKIIPQAQCIDIMKNIITGYKSIWKANIVHRDFKPSNILLKDSQVKIADFGFSMYQKDKKQYQKINVGSPYYMPLQVLGYNCYSYQSDIWALGIIFYEMITGSIPWRARTQRELFNQMKQFKIDKYMPQNISQKSKEFLIKTLQVDPKKRMKPQQLIDFIFQNDQQEQALDLRNSIRSQNAHSLQKTLKKTRTLHDPQKCSRININALLNNVNDNQQKSKKTKDSTENDSDKNSQNDQNQNEDIYIGVNDGIVNNEINVLAHSRMKNQSNQQKIDSVDELPPTINHKKKNMQRKTSLQVNYQPFQNQKQQNSSQSKKVQSLKAISNPEVIISAKNDKIYESKPIKKQVVKQLPEKTKEIQQSPINNKNEINKIQQQKKQQFQQMKKFSKILRSQIHFCRYIFKLLKKVIQCIPQQTNLIKNQFKQLMACLIFYKLQKIQKQKISNPQIMKQWLQTKQWDKIKKVLKQYKSKYNLQLENLIPNLQKQFSFEKFKKLLRKSILHLYKRAYDAYVADEEKGTKQSKLKVKRAQSQKSSTQEEQDNESQIMKIKQQIIILDYFITLKQLLRLEQKYGWQGFEQKANIQTIVQGDTLKYIQKKHILAISQKLQNLKIL